VAEQSESIVVQARDLMQQGQHQEAVDLLQPWLADNPNDADGWATLGAAHFELENWPDAERAARVVVRLRPESAREWCNLGVILRKLNRVEDAAAMQRRALEADPTYERASAEMQKLNPIGRGRQGHAPSKTKPGTREAPWQRLKWGVAVAVLLVVAVVYGKPLVVREPEQSTIAQQQDRAATQSELAPVSNGSSDPSESSASVPKRHVGTAPPDEHDRDDVARRVVLGRRAVRLGKRLFGKGLYAEAKRAFILASECAPELNDPKTWLKACDDRIAQEAAGPSHPAPETTTETASYLGGEAAGPGVTRSARTGGAWGITPAELWWDRDQEIMDMGLSSEWENLLLDFSQLEYEADMF